MSIVQFLLDNRADKNFKTKDGICPLAITYKNGNDGIQNLLQEIWEDINSYFKKKPVYSLL